jgi:hypothetical protein
VTTLALPANGHSPAALTLRHESELGGSCNERR